MTRPTLPILRRARDLLLTACKIFLASCVLLMIAAGTFATALTFCLLAARSFGITGNLDHMISALLMLTVLLVISVAKPFYRRMWNDPEA